MSQARNTTNKPVPGPIMRTPHKYTKGKQHFGDCDNCSDCGDGGH